MLFGTDYQQTDWMHACKQAFSLMRVIRGTNYVTDATSNSAGDAGRGLSYSIGAHSLFKPGVSSPAWLLSARAHLHSCTFGDMFSRRSSLTESFFLLFLAARGHVCLAGRKLQTFRWAGREGAVGLEPTTCARREAAFKRD